MIILKPNLVNEMDFDDKPFDEQYILLYDTFLLDT